MTLLDLPNTDDPWTTVWWFVADPWRFIKTVHVGDVWARRNSHAPRPWPEQLPPVEYRIWSGDRWLELPVHSQTPAEWWAALHAELRDVLLGEGA